MNTRNFLKSLFVVPVAVFAASSTVPSLDNVDKSKPEIKVKPSLMLTPTEIVRHWRYVRSDVSEIDGKWYACVTRRLPVAISTDIFDAKTSKWIGNPMIVLAAKMCIVDAVNKLGFTHVQAVKGILHSDQVGTEPRLSVYAYGFFKKL